MIRTFSEAAEKTGAVVTFIDRSSSALQDFLKEKTSGFKDIICAEPRNLSRKLFEPYIDDSSLIKNPTIANLAASPLGIGEAFAAVAHTGSVCIALDSPLSGLEGLLPFEHIVVLEAKNIVRRPSEIFQLKQVKSMNNGWVYITGPSATADMGELVKGAHGPAKLTIVILR